MRIKMLAASVVFAAYMFPLAAFADRSHELTALGHRYMSGGDMNGAAACYTKAVLADPSNLEARRFLAQAELKAGRVTSALAVIQPVVAIDHSPENLVVLADVFYALGRYSEATRAYSQILFMDEQHPGASLGLVNTYSATGERDQAIAACKAAIARTRNVALANALAARLSELTDPGRATQASPLQSPAPLPVTGPGPVQQQPRMMANNS